MPRSRSRGARLAVREARLITKELRMLGVSPKTIAKIWAVIIGVPLTLVLGYLGVNYSRDAAQRREWQRIEAAQRAKIAEQEGKVQLSVTFDFKNCPKTSYPLYTNIVNGSNQTIVKTNWSFEVYRVDFSTQLARDHSFTTDRIIKPGEHYATCWSMPELDLREAVPFSQLECRIARKNVTFQEPMQERDKRK